MSETITFGAAQIPVTDKIDTNLVTLKRAIDWAEENNVDYLLTPEGSLSGYVPSFNEEVSEEAIVEAVWEIVDYAAAKKVGLALGTKYKEDDKVFNQIRVYDKEGLFVGAHDKMYSLAEYDRSEMPHRIDPITIKHNGYKIKALCLLCNDFWGGYNQDAYPLPKVINEPETAAHLILHGSNGFRGFGLQSEDILYEWHNAVLRFMSFELHTHVITADNSITMHGGDYDGRTSSRSGVVYNGQWLTEEKNVGEQYFKIELDCHKLTNWEYKVDPDIEQKRKYNIGTHRL